MNNELVKRAFLGKLLGATGIGPVANKLKSISAKSSEASNMKALRALDELIPQRAKEISKLQDEVASRGSFWHRNLSHFWPGNAKKLEKAQGGLDELLDAQMASRSLRENTQQALKGDKETIARLAKEMPEELGRMGTLYGSGALGGGAYYGMQQLDPEESPEEVPQEVPEESWLEKLF